MTLNQKMRRSLLLSCLLLTGMTAHAAPTAAQRTQAATAVAQSDAQCKVLGDFYWEVGDARGVLGSGQVGSKYNANEPLKIASASKWVFGAYVLEKIGRNQEPTPDQVAMLQMRSGYTHFNPLKCLRSKTINSCMNSRGNDERAGGDVGKFSYGGGHSQKLAQQLGLGGFTAEQMTADLQRYIGNIGIEYAQPQPAGGMRASPAAYGQFLRKVLSGELRMKQFLGYKPVCTKCAEAAASPAPGAWHYSLNHWVEDDAQGDGAFSSPGLMGFYPWISADKSTYGIVARQKLSRTAYQESAACGRKIRTAWINAR